MLVELFKLAHKLDKLAEYELANEVDEVVKELSQRAGLTAEDMVSLANYFDENGETKLSDKFDAMLKNIKK
jgi:NTP pyrophosphatase (non-canonical NTP hydrolase)